MAPKRAFGGVLRPFGRGFRGPNRERASVFSGAGQGGAGGSAVEPGGGASVFSGAGRGRCRGFCGGAGAGPARSAVGPGAGRGRNRRGFCGAGGGGASVFSGAGQGRDGEFRGADGTDRPPGGRRGALPVDRRPAPSQRPLRGAKPTAAPPGRKKSVPRGRCARRQDAKKVFRGEGAPPPEHIRAQKNGPRSVHFYFCYTTLLLYGLLLRDARPIHPAARQRLRTPGARLFAGDFRQHVLLQQPVCLRFRSARRSGVTAVKASAIRSLSRSAARRSGLSRLAAGISAVRAAPRESLRPPPGSQFSAARVTVLSRRGHSSQPSGVSAVRSPELAVPAARPLRRRGHSTTTSVWPSTCNWRISCVELT